MDGLRDVVDGAGLEGAEFLLGLVERGHEEHRHVAGMRVSLETLAGGDAVHAGHHKIEEHDVGRGVFEERERAAAALGDEDFVAGFGERIEQERKVGGGVVDDEDATRVGTAHGDGERPEWARSRSSRMRSMR